MSKKYSKKKKKPPVKPNADTSAKAPVTDNVTVSQEQALTEDDVSDLVKKTDYPDINKANTKTIVIWSLIVVVLILLLSIFVPPSSISETTATTETSSTADDISTEDSTSDAKATESENSTENTSETSTPALFDMGKIETSTTMEVFSMPDFPTAQSGFLEINGVTYYLQEGETPFTGWLNINNLCYYIKDDGTITTGWQEIDGVSYYFNKNGIMQTNQWIDGKYLGTAGNMYVNTITPDGIYVDKDGLEDTSLGKQGSTEGLTDLKATLEEMLSGYSGTWSVYVKDIENKEYLSINNTQMFSASLIKLYCAATAFDLIEQGELEKTERIQSLMYQMISISDNDAFNLMVATCSGTNSQVAGRPIIQKYIDNEGYVDTTLTSMLLPTKYRSPSSSGRNYTTVEDCGLLLEKIYKGKCVNQEVSREFLNLLLNQTHINKIPAGLPAGTKCANKTGDTDEFQHDAAIVYSPGGDYIITVMSNNSGSAIINTQNISKVVYDYFN